MIGHLDERAAERAVIFVNGLSHTGDHEGKPFDLRPWQADITRRLWGTLDGQGRRQYRTLFLFIPRGNGKTEFLAAQLLYGLCGFPKARRLYAAARDAEQAGQTFDAMASMVRQKPALAARCIVRESYKRIIYKPTGSLFKALADETGTVGGGKHGKAAAIFAQDEMHACDTSRLWDALSGSQGKIEEPLRIIATTAGNADHVAREHLLWKYYLYAKKCLDDPTFDPTWLVAIYEKPAELDWTDEAGWHAANPALGDFYSLDHLRNEFREAQEIPARQSYFRQWYLNDWTVGAAEKWIPKELWARNAGSIPDLSGRECYAGLDLSATRDTTALVLVFPVGDLFYVLPYLWVPGETAQSRERTDKVPYLTWSKLGFLELTDGPSVDYGAVTARIAELGTRYKIKQIAFDPWGAPAPMQDLQRLGFRVVETRQGYKTLSYPSKELEKLLLAGKLRHGGHPVLAWQANNAVRDRDSADNIKPNKAKSSDRIDALVALIMALGLAVSGKGTSVYSTRGVRYA